MAADQLRCDSQRIQRVLSHFLSNAAKYDGKDGKVLIAVPRSSQHLRVRVTDHGPGIHEGFRARVVTRFAMTDSSPINTSKHHNLHSSGLSLSIAKAIIEQHAGTIGFDTRSDENLETGTPFWLASPIVP